MPHQCSGSKAGNEILKVWLSGDFSVGNSQPPRPRKDRHPLEGIYLREILPPTAQEPEFEAWILAANPKTHEVVFSNRQDDLQLADMATDDLICLYQFFESRQDWERCQKIAAILATPTAGAPMGLSVLTNFTATTGKEKTIRQPCGFGGITSRGKKMLRSGAVVLSENIPRQCVTFLTLTVPALSIEEMKELNLNFGSLMDSLLKWLKRRLGSGYPPVEKWLYALEIQEQRQFDLGGFPVLHVHMVFQGRLTRYSPWFIDKTEIKKEWQKLIESILGRPVNCDAATRIESVRGDIKKEISKYVSKGSKTVKAAVEAGYGQFIPKQWWGMSRKLSQIIRLNIRRFTGKIVAIFVSNMYAYQRAEVLKYKAITVSRKIVTNKGDPKTKEIHVIEEEKEMIVGFCGFTDVDDLADLLVSDKSEVPNAIKKARQRTKNNVIDFYADKLDRFKKTAITL